MNKIKLKKVQIKNQNRNLHGVFVIPNNKKLIHFIHMSYIIIP